jgi:DNA polymerase III delta subunit
MFRKNLSAKKLAPIYFLAGEEPFLLEDSLKRIEKVVNTDDLNSFPGNGMFRVRHIKFR